MAKNLRFLLVLVVLGILGSSLFALAEGPAVPAGSAASAPSAPAQQPPSAAGMFLPMIAMFGVIYFLMIRPQQKKVREQQDMLKQLKHGDEIVTTSGLLGKVTGITDSVVTLEVADNVRLKMLKSQVSQVVKGQVKDLA